MSMSQWISTAGWALLIELAAIGLWTVTGGLHGG